MVMRPIDADAMMENLIQLEKMCTDAGKDAGGFFRSEYWAGAFTAVVEAKIRLKEAPTVAGDINVPGNWISVKDMLPDAGVKCLIVDGRGDVTVGEQIDREKRIWQWKDSDFYARGGVTHWMPLPPGPEVDE